MQIIEKTKVSPFNRLSETANLFVLKDSRKMNIQTSNANQKIAKTLYI